MSGTYLFTSRVDSTWQSAGPDTATFFELGWAACRDLVAENVDRGFRTWMSDEAIRRWRSEAIRRRAR